MAKQLTASWLLSLIESQPAKASTLFSAKLSTSQQVELAAALQRAKSLRPTIGVPHPRQRTFLDLESEEALYGGAAGGGKTFALLQWLGQGYRIPSYSGIFFRRTYPMLSKSGDSPIAKSHELYVPLGGVYSASERRWRFPSGAMIEFGHLQHENSVYDYQGAAFHRVAFDELTQFSESQYTYLFSRMRKVVEFPLPVGIRAGSNPGGVGHQWVRQRFITREAEAQLRGLDYRVPSQPGLVFWPTASRAFVPSRVADNPSLDIEDYAGRMLEHLPPVLRERLLNGDWSVTEDACIRPDWLRYWRWEETPRGREMYFMDGGGNVRFSHQGGRNSIRFATSDTAGTSEDRAREGRGKPPSWSVIAMWEMFRHNDRTILVLLDVWRARVAFTDLLDGFREMQRRWSPDFFFCENAHHGPAVASILAPEVRIQLQSSKPPALEGGTKTTGKLQRATRLLVKLSQGEVFLPEGNVTWLPTLESEWLSWQGTEDETADQIDVASYAAIESDRLLGSQATTIDLRPIRRASRGIV